MAHTMWGARCEDPLNGEEIGESGLNAHLAWYYGVPIIRWPAGILCSKEQLRMSCGTDVQFVQTKETIDSSGHRLFGCELTAVCTGEPLR